MIGGPFWSHLVSTSLQKGEIIVILLQGTEVFHLYSKGGKMYGCRHIQTSRIILCETSNYRERVAWFPIIDLVDISCPCVATDARDRMNRIEYVASLGCALVNLHLQTGQYIA